VVFIKIVQILNGHIGFIDLRPTEQFIERHIKGCTSIPVHRLDTSIHELPVRQQPIALIGDQHQIEYAQEFLTSKNYQVINQFTFTDEVWKSAAEFNLLDSGCQSVQLWQANPLLVEAIETIEKHVTGRNVIDLACGAGRDSVYMAMRGWTVNSVDYKQDALDRAINLAAINSVELSPIQIDLEDKSDPFDAESADLIMVMRYLHRPLFSVIDGLIKPGGAIFYSTFMIGCEQFGSPKNPNYLLRDGELAEIFSNFESNYEILIDEKRHLADGRPVACFLARKRF